MTEIFRDIIDHPSAWKGSDFKGPDDVSFDMTEHHRDALRGVVARARAAGHGLQELTPDETAMPEIEGDLNDLHHELMDGRGVLLVRGWPIEEMSDEELALAYWAMGTYFGRGVSQSPMGDRLGYVTDVSKPGTQERGYRSAKELNLHTDSDDIVGLLCIRQAKSGGQSRLASSVAIYNEIAATRPDLLEPLFHGYRYHWFGEQPPGEGVVTSYDVPVFGHAGGRLSCIFLREFIHMAAEELGKPLGEKEAEALTLFGEIAEREDIQFRYRLEPGWASFINNYTTLHSRTGFEDWEEIEKRRMLLRLWLKGQPARPLVENQKRYYGEDGMHVDGRENTIFDPNRQAAE
ncbi:MAG: TauD/TfdA family dioxygenase [Rhodospirillaceae bacterium]|jgi:hypothetical protein|nr:TauD/TfdA family dioxygenase [Rhodospirillaceae bacterium]MBT5434306.1 TauD/TfdA family dioxygenase [Rhodospirillaceae bacterium]MBT6202386.1 TauD/TfdA family dioxygenase [Rhodospirillaceae bacterium]MBT6510693.1 TauD/TfdA family dioxygenase [Rhodospirillaceae bacterium]MBT7614612.1 TauD/TfdA family dioxygenase [Rhodospirillaceae bacterium]